MVEILQKKQKQSIFLTKIFVSVRVLFQPGLGPKEELSIRTNATADASRLTINLVTFLKS